MSTPDAVVASHIAAQLRGRLSLDTLLLAGDGTTYLTVAEWLRRGGVWVVDAAGRDLLEMDTETAMQHTNQLNKERL